MAYCATIERATPNSVMTFEAERSMRKQEKQLRKAERERRRVEEETKGIQEARRRTEEERRERERRKRDEEKFARMWSRLQRTQRRGTSERGARSVAGSNATDRGGFAYVGGEFH